MPNHNREEILPWALPARTEDSSGQPEGLYREKARRQLPNPQALAAPGQCSALLGRQHCGGGAAGPWAALATGQSGQLGHSSLSLMGFLMELMQSNALPRQERSLFEISKWEA
jgi:hypothetical protein